MGSIKGVARHKWHNKPSTYEQSNATAVVATARPPSVYRTHATKNKIPSEAFSLPCTFMYCGTRFHKKHCRTAAVWQSSFTAHRFKALPANCRKHAPAERDSHDSRDRPDRRSEHDLGRGARRRVGEGPDRAEVVFPEAAVDGQADSARPDRVDGHVEELHAHGVEDLESKQSP